MSKVLSNRKVLIVEDDYANQRVASLFLKRLGCITEIAENGAIAVEKIQEMDFEMILMDCQMPVMDGLESTKKIRELGHVEVPIIAMTANINFEDRQKCFDSGMNDFVSKPINLNGLKELMLKWLSP